jgi:hypothetical protein
VSTLPGSHLHPLTDPRAPPHTRHVLTRDAPAALRSALRHLDAERINTRVRREVRNREAHLPPESTYRWWARRTESVNGAIIDAVNRGRQDRGTCSRATDSWHVVGRLDDATAEYRDRVGDRLRVTTAT